MPDPKKRDPEQEPDEKHPGLAPDPETLKTTDPQENMEGPVSTVMQNIKEEAQQGNEESKEEADQRKDRNT